MRCLRRKFRDKWEIRQYKTSTLTARKSGELRRRSETNAEKQNFSNAAKSDPNNEIRLTVISYHLNETGSIYDMQLQSRAQDAVQIRE
jgi:hypothetical protein